MYLPENETQMFDILADLRTYAASNGLPRLAEELDDAMMTLVSSGGVDCQSAAKAQPAKDQR